MVFSKKFFLLFSKGLKGIKEGELKKTKQNKNFHPVIKCILMAQ